MTDGGEQMSIGEEPFDGVSIQIDIDVAPTMIDNVYKPMVHSQIQPGPVQMKIGGVQMDAAALRIETNGVQMSAGCGYTVIGVSFSNICGVIDWL